MIAPWPAWYCGPAASPRFCSPQVLRRRTPKVDFDLARPVAPDLLKALLASASRSGSPQAGGTVEPARLDALRALCWQSAQVELRTPRTMMESIRLTRVGPSEILEHRDGISLNTPFIRAAAALGFFDRSAPPEEGSAGYKGAMDRFEGHSRTAMGFVWLTGATPAPTRSRPAAPTCACNSRPPNWAWACIP